MDLTTSVAPSTLFVTGATGFIGSRFATLAMRRGFPVRSLTRSEWGGEPAIPAGERFLGSLPFGIPDGCLAGVGAVIHCAAHTGSGSGTESRAVNLLGTLRLARSAARQGVSRFIFLSSQSARPDHPSAYGRTKYEAEKSLLGLEGIRTYVLRPGLVYGCGSRGLFHRMEDMVRRLPVLPLLDGGSAPVQPIHVDDLCEAIFRVLDLRDGGAEALRLGDPLGLSLKAFLQEVSMARRGGRRFVLPVPLWPVERMAAAAEALRIPFPVTRTNLEGLRAVERMETAADLERLDLKLRSLREGLAACDSPAPDGIPLERRPAGVILVGGGRIGTLHALTASRRRGMRLLAVVDRNPAALSLLRGMGLKTLFIGSLEEALSLEGVDAAILATPPESHLELTRRCLSKGLRVLVEKPLANREDRLRDYEALAREFPGGSILGGYLAPRYPQARAALERLRAGGYGRVRGFVGLTLLSQVLDGKGRRWEVQPSISGGGVLINSGGHVLSLVRAAFGDPETVSCQSSRIFSGEVEDSFCAELIYPGFRGRTFASWSIEGFPRQENRLIIETDSGALTLTNNTAVFQGIDERVEIAHQLDFDVGFNLMPDYAGGGIAQEHQDLQAAVREGTRPPMGLPEAAGVEGLLFRLYGCARDVKSFAMPEASPGRSPARAIPEKAEVPPATHGDLVLDLRDLSPEEASAFAASEASGCWSAILLRPSQSASIGTARAAPDRIRITVPDFLHQARLIASGQRGRLLAECGPGGLLAALRSTVPAAVRARGLSFWAVAHGLLAADLSRVPRGFPGTLLVHPYLVDIALALRRPDDLARMIAACRRRAPSARVGIHTNLLRESMELVALGLPIDDIHFLSSPSSQAIEGALRLLEEEAPSLRLTAEVGPAPAIVHRVAAADPARWVGGAAGLVVGAAADRGLTALREERLRRAWTAAFPGLDPEGGVL